MRIVLDTNVLVSAMLTAGGTSDFALQLVLGGYVSLLADSRIPAEYDGVTARARFRFRNTATASVRGAGRTMQCARRNGMCKEAGDGWWTWTWRNSLTASITMC